jgi:hypothetical protein
LSGKWGWDLDGINYDGADVLTNIAHEGLLKRK